MLRIHGQIGIPLAHERAAQRDAIVARDEARERYVARHGMDPWRVIWGEPIGPSTPVPEVPDLDAAVGAAVKRNAQVRQRRPQARISRQVGDATGSDTAPRARI